MPMENKQNEYVYITGFGEDSHQFKNDTSGCIIAGHPFLDTPSFDADSDGDVAYHALCQAITSVTHVPILGKVAIELCKEKGVKDSRVFVAEALKTLKNMKILHCVVSLTAQKPRLQPQELRMRQNIAKTLQIDIEQVGMVFTTGNSMCFASQGKGVTCRAVVTFLKKL
jgi:2-C-methyl-D-erythritol 2,4-cyclodiphosphate synthase